MDDPKQKSNVALARAIAYFTRQSYAVFLPLGDRGWAIDLVVSPNGLQMLRVQCKYTQHLHTASILKNPESRVWQADLRQIRKRPRIKAEPIYDLDSFDLLFICTPDADYLIDWRNYCKGLARVPYSIRLGKKLACYKVA